MGIGNNVTIVSFHLVTLYFYTKLYFLFVSVGLLVIHEKIAIFAIFILSTFMYW